MNSALRDSGIFDEVWIQPATGDAGTALAPRSGPTRANAAGSSTRRCPACSRVPTTERSRSPSPPGAGKWTTPTSAPGFDESQIEAQLKWAKLDYERCGDLARATAELLADDCIVGWFQGRMEFGPRALGARSILASPIDPAMQARINELKDREDFRPVAPAVPVERLGEWFSPASANRGVSPFMLFLYDARPERVGRIPSACHSDGTARVQTVDRATNPAFHALLEAFGERTGVPILINTSFNVRGEPIVGTPRAAIEAFFSTPLDALVIGPFIVRKTGGAARRA